MSKSQRLADGIIYADVYARVMQARRLIVACEENNTTPNQWVKLYAYHCASLLEKLRIKGEKLGEVWATGLPENVVRTTIQDKTP